MDKKVQDWLDAYERRNLLPSSPSITSSTEPTLFIADEENNDTAIVINSYACNEVVRILDLSEDEYYVPSSGLIMHIIRWAVIALEERFAKTQWNVDMADTIRASIASRYGGKNDVGDSD